MRSTYKGCNDRIPNLDAKTPVTNGRTALPLTPIPEIHPTQAVSIQCGRMREECATTMGKKGPSRRPIMETAMAFCMMEGTNQIVSSRLQRDC